jgi:hypothetical protein
MCDTLRRYRAIRQGFTQLLHNGAAQSAIEFEHAIKTRLLTTITPAVLCIFPFHLHHFPTTTWYAGGRSSNRETSSATNRMSSH